MRCLQNEKGPRSLQEGCCFGLLHGMVLARLLSFLPLTGRPVVARVFSTHFSAEDSVPVCSRGSLRCWLSTFMLVPVIVDDLRCRPSLSCCCLGTSLSSATTLCSGCSLMQVPFQTFCNIHSASTSKQRSLQLCSQSSHVVLVE
jgi:hypothetical protein